MRSLDPSGDPRAALDNGWAIERPSSATVEAVARRIELEPWSSHLLLGGIGSGKTTELWRIHRRLRELADETGDATQYVDVAKETRLDLLAPGVLLALAGKRLVDFEQSVRRARGRQGPSVKVATAIKKIRELAHGYTWYQPIFDDYEEEAPEDDYYPAGVHRVDGLVTAPAPLSHQASEMVPHLKALKNAIIEDQGHCVLLFDSLDRIPKDKDLEPILRDDVRGLHEAEIGVVLVGPMRLQYEASSALHGLFPKIHSILEIEPIGDGLGFLVQVLERRTPRDVMPTETCQRLAKASGGVLRDLIALAKSAAQEAYVSGSDFVTTEHVARAAEQFGRTRAVGLDSEQVAVLKKVHDRGTLVIRGERELALLETRRVLDYGGGRFVVHPTLAPLLDLITVAA